MYKLGIVLFGQPRYHNIVKKYYDEAFAGCEIDYFLHAWNIDSVDGRNQFPDDRLVAYSKKDAPENSIPWVIRYDVKKLKQELQDTYNTSNVIVSDYDRHVHMLRRVGSRQRTGLGWGSAAKDGKLYVHQWRSFEKVSKLLKRSEKEYDLIVCSRFDVIFEPETDLIKRLLDIIKKNKSPNLYRKSPIGELIICCTFADADKHDSGDWCFDGMYDLFWFGTKKGMIRFGHNFTRNQISDSNFPTRGYRARWADQLKRNRVTVYPVPDNWGSATIVKPECPRFDIETIKNYGKYHDRNTRGKIELEDLKPYDPNLKIIKEPLFHEIERSSPESFERSVARSPYAYNFKSTQPWLYM